MKIVNLTWNEIRGQTQEILRLIAKDEWVPDYVIGITRGGLIPANLISQYLDCPMYTLQVRLRDSENEFCESNLSMAEDAFGYECTPDIHTLNTNYNPDKSKNILIVDDINDSGATLNWIMEDWKKSCCPTDLRWSTVWGNNVRVAVLCDNETSAARMTINYSAMTVNKVNDPQWIVFPWENWWKV